MATPRQARGSAVASGERSVAVGGDVVDSVIVTGDHARIELLLGPESGALLELLRKSQVPTKRLRPLPLDDRPAAFSDHLDREDETARLLESSGEAGSVNVHGPAGIGKTYLLHRAAQEPAASRLPDGVASLFAKNKTGDDLLQELFESFYECTPPYRAPGTEIRSDLRDRRALVLLDSLELERDEAQALVAAAPGCRFLVTSRERRLWAGGSFLLAGLSAADARLLLEVELGRPIGPDEQDAAGEICRRTGGSPLRIRQAGSLARERGRSLQEVADVLDEAPAAAELSPAERELMAMLAAVPGTSVGADRLREAVARPEGVDAALSRLSSLGLIQSHSPRYSSHSDPDAGPLTDEEIQRGGEALLRAFVSWAEQTRQDFRALLAEAPAIVGLLRWAMRHDRDAEALRLARAVDAAFAWARRFGAWGELVDAALHAARRTGDRDGEAWALHEAGTRAFALGDRPQAIADLQAALEIRRGLGDEPGAQVTRHNLSLVSRPAWFVRFVSHAPVTTLAIVVGAVALVLAGGGGAAGWFLTRDHGPGSESKTLDVRLAGAGNGSVAGSGIDCPGSCSKSIRVGSRIMLTASSARRSVFRHWAGMTCEEGQTAPTCVFVLSGDVTATALFAVPTETFTLNVAVSGPGTGSVDGALDCPGRCRGTLPAGSHVQLIAHAGNASRFDHWTDVTCDEGQLSSTCTLTLTAETTATAVFARAGGSHTLDVSVRGDGSVRGTLDCASACRATLSAGSPVTLTARASHGSAFDRWTGVTCSEGQASATCSFELTSDLTATAVFTEAPPGRFTLGVTVSGDGQGSVLGTLPCSDRCQETLASGTYVTLTASAREGSAFDHWTGVTCDEGQSSPTCSFSLTRNETATAEFALARPVDFTLAVTVSGTGKGSVIGTLDCSDSCHETFPSGTAVTLTANPADGDAFDHWAGATCDGGQQTSLTCSFTLTANLDVTAVFAPGVRLTVKTGSGGTVTSDPAGVACRPTCQALFPLGRTVILSAVPGDGYHFAGWGGSGCSGTGTCSVVMDGKKSVTAKFTD